MDIPICAQISDGVVGRQCLKNGWRSGLFSFAYTFVLVDMVVMISSVKKYLNVASGSSNMDSGRLTLPSRRCIFIRSYHGCGGGSGCCSFAVLLLPASWCSSPVIVGSLEVLEWTMASN